jgi:hypothetical protein
VSPPSGGEVSLSSRTYAPSHGPSAVPEFALLTAAMESATNVGASRLRIGFAGPLRAGWPPYPRPSGICKEGD